MRRSASEVINDLESRVARLEKQAKKATIASEEKIVERFIKSTRGVFDVSVDLSKRNRITLDINFHGIDFHFEGECMDDMEGIYAGSKTANPGALGAFFMMRGLRPRRRGRGRSRHVGNTYRFEHPHPLSRSRWDAPSIYVFTQFGEMYSVDTKKIYETLRQLLSDTMKKRDIDEAERQREEELRIERKRSEEARAHGERVRLEREERKRRRTEMYEANRAKNNANRAKKQKRQRDWG